MAMRSRREFLMSAAAVGHGAIQNSHAQKPIARVGGPQVKISLNAYSFNRALQEGTMTLDDLLEFSAETGFKAVDPTAYYFPNYPESPDDEYLYRIKRKAYLLGLDISGTGIRTDFTKANPGDLQEELDRVAIWCEVACRLGAPSLRVFAGPEVQNREEATPQVVDSLRKCAELGSQYGVMIVIQNHYHFIKTPDQLQDILRRVDSEWLAAHLDVGSFRSKDPYEEIARAAPFAAIWQIKESVYFEDRQTRVDLRRIANILQEVNFRGYVLVETLGEGDPKTKVPRFFREVSAALAGVSRRG
jgi:sugar phosphate isomerase/epimerase